jgi:hypothetical protein
MYVPHCLLMLSASRLRIRSFNYLNGISGYPVMGDHLSHPILSKSRAYTFQQGTTALSRYGDGGVVQLTLWVRQIVSKAERHFQSSAHLPKYEKKDFRMP